MKKVHSILVTGVLLGVLSFSPVARAFTAPLPPGFEILNAKGIEALSDEKIVDAYIDTIAEIEAQRVLHMTAGFSTKEYSTYKDLIRYRLRLLLEINRRKLEVPPAVN